MNTKECGGGRGRRRRAAAVTVTAVGLGLVPPVGAAPSGTGDRIIFGTPRFGLASIRPDGTDRRQITTADGPFHFYSPDVSPDGSRIAFQRCSNSTASCELIVAGIDGDNLTTVALPASVERPGRPAWSPDGSRLAFIYETNDGLKVGVVRLDGSDLRSVGGGGGVDWSPDGRLLVLVFGLADGPVVVAPDELWVRSLDGTGQLLRRFDDGLVRHARWSPDGTMIAFTAYRPHSAGENPPPWIEVMNGDGSGRRRIRLGAGYGASEVAWSPDSRALVGAGLGGPIDLAGHVIRDLGITAWLAWANPTGPTPCGGGYWLVGADGGVFSFGTASFHGSTGDRRLNQPIVGMAATPSGKGYWLVGTDGGVFSFGDAPYAGSTGDRRLNRPIVGMAATPSGKGYWLVGSDGGVFAFGDASFFGSTGGRRLNRPIVAMAATPSGQGYWLVGSDGGVFAFGDAAFWGSTGAMRLNQPIVSLAPTTSGRGYWLASADGGTFNYGDAPYLGSAAAVPLGSPVRTAPTVSGEDGLMLVTEDGQTVPLGGARFCGSLHTRPTNQPIVAAAVHASVQVHS